LYKVEWELVVRFVDGRGIASGRFAGMDTDLIESRMVMDPERFRRDLPMVESLVIVVERWRRVGRSLMLDFSILDR
jgi:hypothetical protein